MLLEKLKFSGKSVRNFCQRQISSLLWRLSFGIDSFEKDCLQSIVNRISIKMLEKYRFSYVLRNSSKFKNMVAINDVAG